VSDFSHDFYPSRLGKQFYNCSTVRSHWLLSVFCILTRTMFTPRKRSRSVNGTDELDLGGEGDITNLEPFSSVVVRKGKRVKKNIITTATLSQPNQNASLLSGSTCSVSTSASCEPCVFCSKKCDTIASIQCDTCEHFYHLKCCGVNSCDFGGIQTVVAALGWTCKACRGILSL